MKIIERLDLEHETKMDVRHKALARFMAGLRPSERQLNVMCMAPGRMFTLSPMARRGQEDFSVERTGIKRCEGQWMLVTRPEWVRECKSRLQLVRVDPFGRFNPAESLRVGLHKSRPYPGLWTASNFQDSRKLSEAEKRRGKRAQNCWADVFVIAEAQDAETHHDTIFTLLERLATSRVVHEVEDLAGLDQSISSIRSRGVPTEINRLIAFYVGPPMPKTV